MTLFFGEVTDDNRITRQGNQDGTLKLLYSFRMAQKTELVALCALINNVYRGETAKGGWTTEADLLDGQRCDLTMLKELLTKPNSGFLVICNYRGNSRRMIVVMTYPRLPALPSRYGESINVASLTNQILKHSGF